jgi:hypothetical protein
MEEFIGEKIEVEKAEVSPDPYALCGAARVTRWQKCFTNGSIKDSAVFHPAAEDGTIADTVAITW